MFVERNIRGFDYIIYDDGRLYNKTTGNEIKGHIAKNTGYVVVRVGKKENATHMYLHRIILESFQPIDNKDLTVNHINHIKTDNRLCNLEWITREQNASESYIWGHPNIGETNKNAKLTTEDVIKIKTMLKKYPVKEIAKIFHVNYTTISDIKNKRSWVHIKDEDVV